MGNILKKVTKLNKKVIKIVLTLTMVLGVMLPGTAKEVKASSLPTELSGFQVTWSGSWNVANNQFGCDHNPYQPKVWLENGNYMVDQEDGTKKNILTYHEGDKITFNKCRCYLILGPRHVHNFSPDWETDVNYHWHQCIAQGNSVSCLNVAGAQKGVHNGGIATCTEQAVCVTCGASYGNTTGHNFVYSESNNKIIATCSNDNTHIAELIPNINDTVVYNGSAQETAVSNWSPTTYNSDLVAISNVSSITYEATGNTSLVNGKAINVGTYNAKLTLTVNGHNYTAIKPFTISPLDATNLTASTSYTNDETNWTGSEIEPIITIKHGTTTLTKGTDYEVSGTTKATDPGEYTITITGKDGSNFTGTTTLTWKILGLNFAENDITATPYSGIYEGQQHSISVSAPEGSTVTYSTTQDDEYIATNPTFKDAGTYTVYYKVNKDGYYEYSGHSTVTINPLEVTLDWDNTTLTYNGEDQKPTATVNNKALATDVVTVSVTGEQTNAGTYNATANTLEGTDAGNYKLPTTMPTQSFTINPKAITVTPTQNQNKIYGESDPTYTFTVDNNGLEGTDTLSGALERTSGDSVGFYVYNIGTLDLANPNYSVSLNSSANSTNAYKFEIKKANSSLIAPTAKTLTYNGAEQALLTAGYNVVGGTLKYSLEENGTYDTTIPTKKDAGSYDVYYKVFGDSNHNDTNATKITVTIAQKDITISNIKVNNKTYDGNTESILDYGDVTYGGIINGEKLSVTATGTFSDKNASNNAKTANISDIELHNVENEDYLKNYKLAETGQQATAIANITKKDITTTITPNGGTYASTITAASALLNGTVSGDNIRPVITYTGSDNEGTTYDTTTKPTKAGTYTVTVSLDGNDKDNYNLTDTKTAEFVINKAKVTAPSENTNPFTYNTQEQTYTLTTNSLYTISNNTRTNSGSQTVTVSLNDSNNYEWTDSTITNKTFTFTINKAKVTAPSKDETVFTYNTEDQTYALTINPLYEITNNIKKDAGTYIVNVALKDKDNYLWSDTLDAEDKTYDFVINPADSKNVKVVIDDEHLTFKYDKNNTEGYTVPVKLTFEGKDLIEGTDFYIVSKDDVKTNHATKPGKYTLEIKLSDNYLDKINKNWSVNEVIGVPTEVKLGDENEIYEGELTVTTSANELAPVITVNNPLSVITTTELEKLKDGSLDVDVIITADSKETNDIEELSLKEINKVANTSNIKYLDISIDKILKHKVKNDNDVFVVVDVETIPVTETEEEVEITVDVPKTIPGAPSGYKRTYTIIRSHLTEVEPEEGQESQDPQFEYVAKKLDTKYSNGTLTFKTNLFSDYAVMYVDTFIPRPAASEYKAPNTGVTATATQGLVELGAIAVGSLFAVISNKKKKEN